MEKNPHNLFLQTVIVPAAYLYTGYFQIFFFFILFWVASTILKFSALNATATGIFLPCPSPPVPCLRFQDLVYETLLSFTLPSI